MAAVYAVAGVVLAVRGEVERVPWVDGSSVFTAAFEESAAYLAQVTDRTPVSRLLGISWVAVATSWNASSLGGLTERPIKAWELVYRLLDGVRFPKVLALLDRGCLAGAPPRPVSGDRPAARGG